MSAPAIAEQVEALKHIRQADRLYIDVATTTTNADQLAAAAEQMTAALREIPQLADVRGEINLADMGAAYGQLQAQLPALAQLERTARTRTAPDHDRAGKTAGVAEKIHVPAAGHDVQKRRADRSRRHQRHGVRAAPRFAGRRRRCAHRGGRITSADGCHVLINATPEFRSSETGKSAALIAAVLKAARSVETGFRPGAVKISVTGAHRSALDNATMIRQDTTRTSVIATIAIAVLIWPACRRRWLALLALFRCCSARWEPWWFFYLTGDPVSSVALGCGSMLIGVTVDYGIYMSITLDDSPPPAAKNWRAVAQLVPGACRLAR
jgi:predicted exporter